MLLSARNLFRKLFSKKNIQTLPSEDGEWFSFIWYKKMVNGNKTHYTAPFRTKIRAKTREEAVAKLGEFAISKMKLVIVDEKDFSKEDISKMVNSFNKLNEQFEKILGRF